MISIRMSNGEYLDISPETKLKIKRYTHLFKRESLVGMYSIPINIDGSSPKNQRLLEFPNNKHASYKKTKEFNVSVELMDDKWFDATLSVKKPSKAQLKIYLISGSNSLHSLLNNTSLRDLNLDVVDLSEATVPPFTTADLSAPSSPPAIDTPFVVAVTYSTPTSSGQIERIVYYPMLWKGDVESSLADLVYRINTPNLPPVYNAGTAYVTNDIVRHPTTGFYYSAVQATQGDPLTDPAYWYEIETYVGTLGDGLLGFWLDNSFGPLNIYDYDYYTDLNDVTAVTFDNTITIYDESLAAVEHFHAIITNRPLEHFNSYYPAGMAFTITNFEPSNNPGFDYNRYNLSMQKHMQEMAESSYSEGASHTFATVRNDSIYLKEEINELNPNYINNNRILHKYQNYFGKDTWFSTYQWRVSMGNEYYAVTPFPYLLHVIDKALEFLGYVKEGELFENADIQKIILYNNVVINTYYKTGLDTFTEYQPRLIDLANHVPDMTLMEFFVALGDFFFQHIEFVQKENICRWTPLKTILNSNNFDNWTSKADLNFEMEWQEEKGYSLEITPDSSDQFYEEKVKEVDDLIFKGSVSLIASIPTDPETDQRWVYYIEQDEIYVKAEISSTGVITWEQYSEDLIPFRIGNGETKWKANLDVVLTETEDDLHGNRMWLIPKVDYPGWNRAYGFNNEFGLRLMMYQGFHTGQNGENPYPLATWKDENYSFVTISNIILKMNGDKGMYKLFGEGWLEWLDSAIEIEHLVELNSVQLIHMDVTRKKLIDNLFFLISEMEIDTTSDQLQYAKILMKRL